MQNKIYIENLEVLSSIGVYENEKKSKQKLVFNIQILLKKMPEPINDDIKEVTDYGQFRRIILEIINQKHYNLLEKLAHDILKKIKSINNVDKIKIKITKSDIFDDCKVSFELSNF